MPLKILFGEMVIKYIFLFPCFNAIDVLMSRCVTDLTNSCIKAAHLLLLVTFRHKGFLGFLSVIVENVGRPILMRLAPEVRLDYQPLFGK